MSIVLMDVGNTRIKYMHWEQGKESPAFALSHANIAQLVTFFQNLGVVPERIVGTNVAGQAIAQQINRYIRYHVSKSLEVQWVVPSSMNLGLKNLYQQPHTLGSDRWMGVLGCFQQEKQRPFILATFGTTTTIDSVANSCFLGGMILPGVQMMGASLFTGTAQLPQLDWDHLGQVPVFGTNTEQAILSGVVGAQVGAVVQHYKALAQQAQQSPRLFISGGASTLLCEPLTRAIQQTSVSLGFDKMQLNWVDSPVLEGLKAYVLASE